MRSTTSSTMMLLVAVSLVLASLADATTLPITGGTFGTNLLSGNDVCYNDIPELGDGCRPTAFDPFALLDGHSGAIVKDPAFGDPITVHFTFTHAPVNWTGSPGQPHPPLDITQPFAMTGLFVNLQGEPFDLVGEGTMHAFWGDGVQALNFFTFYTFTPAVTTPEPSGVILLMAGLVMAAVAAHRTLAATDGRPLRRPKSKKHAGAPCG